MTNKTTFRKNVYSVVAKIPKGNVATYSQVAAKSGSPQGARAVGQALHFLDDESIPWWRVVNSRGEISLKCDEHPKQLQQKLLENEGIKFTSKHKLELNEYIWNY